MNTELIVQEYEAIREPLRALPDNELLTLVGRLATEYVVWMDGAELAQVALVESVGAGVGIAKTVLDAQRIVLRGTI